MRNKSQENWGVGVTCLSNGNFNAAASRLYYGIFQAVLDYARSQKGYKTDPDPTKRRGVHADMFDRVREDFTKDSDIDKRFKKIYREFRTFRETADYEPDTPSPAEIKEILTDGQLLKDHYRGLTQ